MILCTYHNGCVTFDQEVVTDKPVEANVTSDVLLKSFFQAEGLQTEFQAGN